MDRFGCDECYKLVPYELWCCDHCDDQLCKECYETHERREHPYPISKWRKVPAQSKMLVSAPLQVLRCETETRPCGPLLPVA
jgi:hypothetical protein